MGSDLSRRDLLRWVGATGIAAVAPMALATACEPAGVAQPAPGPDPALAALGFDGRPDHVLGQGGWCWFQDPRMAIDPGRRLWAGTTRSGTGSTDDGVVQLSIVDLAAATPTVLDTRALARSEPDDHSSPSVFVVDGRVQVAWSLHKTVDYLDLAEFDGLALRSRLRVRRPASTKLPARGMAYASAHVVAGTRWLLYRGEQFSWNLLTSVDGRSWTARGLVVAPSASGQRPYLQAASDGTRLHLVVSDSNPTEFRGTSVYAFSIDADLTMRDGIGRAVGRVGTTAPTPTRGTVLVQGSFRSSGGESTDVDAWLCDLRVIDGAPTAILSTRDPWPQGSSRVGRYRHQLHRARSTPTGWSVEPLALAGGELFTNQPDYCGLGTLDPSSLDRVVVSTNVDPTSGVLLVSAADGRVHHELFEGRRQTGTQGGDAGWAWSPLTRDSAEDNLRPMIVASGPDKVLGWMRGTYRSYADFDTRLVIRTA